MSDKITFKEFTKHVADETGHSENQTRDLIKTVVDTVREGLKEDGEVAIPGFGKFELRWRDERTGRNPQTGEEITIPAQSKPAFKPYKDLRESVNEPFSDLESRVLD